MQRELSRNGVALTDAPSPDTYTVEGKVALGAGKDGKQPITIDWSVTDPDGKKLGTVSQKNEVPQGSLDGSWGKTADAAAAAAAQGIVKLLPQATQHQLELGRGCARKSRCVNFPTAIMRAPPFTGVGPLARSARRTAVEA